MKERYLLTAFVIFISFASACASNCGTYSCPRTFDPPDRTRCCLWSGRNSCCRPGGTTCSDNYKHVRNYCPGPDDENEKVCCTVNNKPKCCSTLLLLTIILPVIAVVVLLPVTILVCCCCCCCCPLAQRRQRRQMQHAIAPYPGPSGTAMPLGPQGYGNQYNQQHF